MKFIAKYFPHRWHMTDTKKFLLTSDSDIKLNALNSYLRDQNIDFSLSKKSDFSRKLNALETVEQPVSDVGGLICCKNRILQIIEGIDTNKSDESEADVTEFDAIVSIENSIKECNGSAVDNVHIIIYDCYSHRFFYAFGAEVPFDYKYFQSAKEKSTVHTQLGWNYTAGEAMFADGITTNSKNWMKDVSDVDRHDQITTVLEDCYESFVTEQPTMNEMIATIGMSTPVDK